MPHKNIVLFRNMCYSHRALWDFCENVWILVFVVFYICLQKTKRKRAELRPGVPMSVEWQPRSV